MNLVLGAVGTNLEEDSNGPGMLRKDIQILSSGRIRRLMLLTIIQEKAVLQKNWSAVIPVSPHLQLIMASNFVEVKGLVIGWPVL